MIKSTSDVDGSWDLTISVPRFGATKTIKVRGELHIGGLLLRLSESFDIQEKEDWSDYALWWPDRNLWLLRTRSTLDQYGVQGSSQLEFTQMHKDLNILMPDLRILKLRTNFSVSVFRVVIQLCKALKLRHPEEMSLSRKLDASEMKKNHGISAVRRTKVPGLSQQMQQAASAGGRSNSLFPNGSETTSGYRSGSITPEGTLERGLFMTMGASTPFDAVGATMSMPSLDTVSATETDLTQSPTFTIDDAMKNKLYCPKNYVEKARTNAGWLDSSRSLMEQGIREDDIAILRYKFFNFYDLNKKHDKGRINQIYQQAKWSILSGEINCTEEEMLVFAALQVQVEKEMQRLQFIPEVDDEDEKEVVNGGVDAALDCLQISLEGTSGSKQHSHITKTPQLRDYLQLCRPKALGMKSYKRWYFVLKDVHMSIFKDENEAEQEPMTKYNLKETELSQVVNLAREEFDLKLLIHENDIPKEVLIRLDSTEKYARWSVAIKMAAKGRTMADSSYDSEVSSLRSILDLQRLQLTQQLTESTPASSPSFDPKSCVAPRFFKKLSVQQAKNRILAVHSKVSTMKLRDAELEYIRAWQMLPEYGNTYFIVKFPDRKKEELLAISTDHMTRMDIQTGDPTKTWNYTTVENWSVNWDTSHVHLSINGRDHALQCYTADCKVIHEFIGGYIFLSLRSPEKSQTLDEEYFQKLTGGRD